MKFIIVIVAWGESYISCLCDIALPSLAFSSNDRSTRKEYEWEFVIYTLPEHQRQISHSLNRHFKGLKRRFYQIAPSSFANHYLAMAHAHNHAAELCADEGARAVIAVPDAVFSQDCLAQIARLAGLGKRAIMTVGPRLRQVSAFEPLKQILREEKAIPSRRLVEVLLTHLHPEMRRYHWDSDNLSLYPTMLYWALPGGYISRNFHLHPLMIDFSEVRPHHSLNRDTIDGEFIGASIGVWDDIHIVQDSDELLVCTLTPDEVSYSPASEVRASVDFLRAFAYNEPLVNPLHRWFLTKAVKIHCRDLNDLWKQQEEESGRIVFELLKKESMRVEVAAGEQVLHTTPNLLPELYSSEDGVESAGRLARVFSAFRLRAERLSRGRF